MLGLHLQEVLEQLLELNFCHQGAIFPLLFLGVSGDRKNRGKEVSREKLLPCCRPMGLLLKKKKSKHKMNIQMKNIASYSNPDTKYCKPFCWIILKALHLVLTLQECIPDTRTPINEELKLHSPMCCFSNL